MNTAAGYPPLVTAYTVRATRWRLGWELSVRDAEHGEIGVTCTNTFGRRDVKYMARDYLVSVHDLTAEEAAALEVEIVRLTKRKPSKRRAR